MSPKGRNDQWSTSVRVPDKKQEEKRRRQRLRIVSRISETLAVRREHLQGTSETVGALSPAVLTRSTSALRERFTTKTSDAFEDYQQGVGSISGVVRG